MPVEYTSRVDHFEFKSLLAIGPLKGSYARHKMTRFTKSVFHTRPIL